MCASKGKVSSGQTVAQRTAALEGNVETEGACCVCLCACELVCTFRFWIACYCWAGVSVSRAGASGQSAGPTGAGGIAVQEGSAGMGGASARFAISSGLTAVRKTVGKEGFAGAETVSAGGGDTEGSPPGRAVGGQGASAGCGDGVAEEKQRAATLEEPALAYAGGGMSISSEAGETSMI